MTWFSRLRARVGGLLARRRANGEAVEELEFHLEREIDARVAGGMSPEEARRTALGDLGGMTQALESIRGVRASWLDAAWQDFVHAGRRLTREPRFAAIAVLTLTLGVGANATVLAIADAVLFRPLPYADPDRVYVLQIGDRVSSKLTAMTPFSFMEAIDDIGDDISPVAFTDTGPRVVVTSPDGPQRVATVAVSSNYFRVLRVAAVRGRTFGDPEARDAGHLALLSYRAWRERFNGDDSIVGRAVTIGNATFEIAGVLPSRFVYPRTMAREPEIVVQMPPFARGTLGGAFDAVVRLGPGITRERAQAELDAAVAPVADRDPAWKDQRPVLVDVRSALYGRLATPIMRLLVASATLILLIGCANLANLLLVRGQRRERDTAMRLALGARPIRIIRPLLFEAALIGAAGAGLAMALAATVFQTLMRLIPPAAYGSAPVGVSGRVAAIATGMSLIGALIFSAVPAWRATRLDVLALIQRRVAPGRVRAWVGRPMIAAQVALSFVAVIGAVAAARAFVAVANTPLGFSPEGVARIDAEPARQDPPPGPIVAVRPGGISLADPPPSPFDRLAFYERVLDALRASPEVITVGAATALPLDGNAPYSGVKLPSGVTGERIGLDYVEPGFFEAIGASLVRGRFLTDDDARGDRSAALVSDAAARVLFPESDALGHTFMQARTNREFRVVGIVANVRQRLDEATPPRAYVLPQDHRGLLTLVVRLPRRNDARLIDLKAAVRAVVPDANVNAAWWSDDISGVTAYRNPRFQTIVLGTFGLLALALTALGVFGVINHVVVSRTREMGVRVAMGAAPQSLARFVLRRALIPVVAGLAVGLMLLRWITPLAEAQLAKVDTRDPRTLAAAAAAVLLAACAAAYLPAYRAGRVDPVRALKAE